MDYPGINRQEQIEAEKFDKQAREQEKHGDTLRMDEEAWTKFDGPVPPSDPYNYSIQLLGNLDNKRVLELGCGTGWLSVILAKRGAMVYGIDISPESVRLAKYNAHIHGVSEKTNFRVMSAHDLDFEDGSFDLAYGLSFLHHVDIEIVIQEIQRVLKKEARAIFMEPFANSRFLQSVRGLVPLPVDDDEEHPRPPLRYQDLAPFSSLFSQYKVKEFQLLMRLERVTASRTFLSILARLDKALLGSFPFLRTFARHIVIEALK